MKTEALITSAQNAVTTSKNTPSSLEVRDSCDIKTYQTVRDSETRICIKSTTYTSFSPIRRNGFCTEKQRKIEIIISVNMDSKGVKALKNACTPTTQQGADDASVSDMICMGTITSPVTKSLADINRNSFVTSDSLVVLRSPWIKHIFDVTMKMKEKTKQRNNANRLELEKPSSIKI